MNPREIYNIFTKSYGLALSKDAVQALEKRKEAEIEEIARILADTHKNKIIRKEDVNACVCSSTVHRRISVEPTKYTPGTCIRYKTLKNCAVQNKTPIAGMKENTEYTVYGIVRVSDRVVIEDEDDEVEVGEIHETEYMLCTGVCAFFTGMYKAGKFDVSRIEVPDGVDKDTKDMVDESTGSAGSTANGDTCNTIFVSQFSTSQESMKTMKHILDTYKSVSVEIGCVVIMVRIEDTIENEVLRIQNGLASMYTRIEFVVIPESTQQKYFYPYGEYRKVKNTIVTTNPSKIKIGNRVWLVGAYNITDGIKSNTVMRGEYRKNMARVYLSQAAYNPFITYTDMSYDEYYDGVVLGEKYDSYVETDKKKAFVVCGEFSKSAAQFMYYDDVTGAFEPSCYNRKSEE